MKNRIRIITTKRGYEHLMKELKNWLKNDEIINELINKDTCTFYGKNIVFIKWDNPKSYKIIQTAIIILRNYRNSYRICVKEGNKINMYSDEFIPNEHIDLPMPVVKCRFDDNETIRQLSKIQVNMENGGDKDGI